VIIQTAKRRTSDSGKRLFDYFHRLSDHLIRCGWWGQAETPDAAAAVVERELLMILAVEDGCADSAAVLLHHRWCTLPGCVLIM
jgi:hypothetical protein